MKAALANQPPTPFRVPPGIDLVSVDRTSGAQASPGGAHSLMEAFKAGSEPWLQVTDPANASANADAANNSNPATDVDQGTGGLY
jgi:penicillin-binding protein 1A